MSAEYKEVKFENHRVPQDKVNNQKVVLTDLLARLNEEKKREKFSNVAFSIAAVSAVAVFGIILSL